MKNTRQKPRFKSKPNEPMTSSFGAMFENQNRFSEKSPVLTGVFTFEPALIQALAHSLETNRTAVQAQICAWQKNASESEQIYLTVKISVPDALQSSQRKQEAPKTEARSLLEHFL